MRKFLEEVGLIESGLSLVERVYKIIMLIFVVAGGGVGWISAWLSPLYSSLGPVFAVAVGLLSALLVTVIMWLYSIVKQKALTLSLEKMLATPNRRINPLSQTFVNEVIDMSDLRLPGQQHHNRKTFRDCQFIGPSVIAFSKSDLGNSKFLDSGSILPVSDPVTFVGVTLFEGCFFENCIFHRIQILLDPTEVEVFRTKKFHVAGDPFPNNETTPG